MALLAGLGQNAFRFSVEWARVEPEEGEFSRSALAHYGRVLDACERNGLLPVVTLHHFTSPRWFAERGGWGLAQNIRFFGRYAARVSHVLGGRMPWVCTLNEPNIVALAGWLSGTFPPGKRDAELRKQVNRNFVAAHAAALEAFKSGPGSPMVGLCLAMQHYQAVDGGEERLARIRAEMHDVYLEAVRTDASDFVGVQTYTRSRIGQGGSLGPEPGVETTSMGYEFWPEALGATVREASAGTGKPVLVTENGIGTDDDTRRVAYIERALTSLHEAIVDGVDVRGYLHWSALDNFEWALGYRPRFGLIAVDRETFARTPKPSAEYYGAICRRNGL
jgi:beta-glucosidase